MILVFTLFRHYRCTLRVLYLCIIVFASLSLIYLYIKDFISFSLYITLHYTFRYINVTRSSCLYSASAVNFQLKNNCKSPLRLWLCVLREKLLQNPPNGLYAFCIYIGLRGKLLQNPPNGLYAFRLQRIFCNTSWQEGKPNLYMNSP